MNSNNQKINLWNWEVSFPLTPFPVIVYSFVYQKIGIHHLVGELGLHSAVPERDTKVYFEMLLFGKKNARDAIRTHEPLQEWILSPSELAGLSYPRIYIVAEIAL